VSGFGAGKSAGQISSSDSACAPGPLEIESTNPSVRIENLANEIEAWMDSGFHGAMADFLKGHTSGGGLGEGKASGSGGLERKPGDACSERSSIGTIEGAETLRRIFSSPPLGQPFGQVFLQQCGHGSAGGG
jgi:hypothetical protein